MSVFLILNNKPSGLGLYNAAKMLAWYNIPVMPHSAVGGDLAERCTEDMFPTLSRVAYTSDSMAKG